MAGLINRLRSKNVFLGMAIHEMVIPTNTIQCGHREIQLIFRNFSC
jgi:hypothetical protein